MALSIDMKMQARDIGRMVKTLIRCNAQFESRNYVRFEDVRDCKELLNDDVDAVIERLHKEQDCFNGQEVAICGFRFSVTYDVNYGADGLCCVFLWPRDMTEAQKDIYEVILNYLWA